MVALGVAVLGAYGVVVNLLVSAGGLRGGGASSHGESGAWEESSMVPVRTEYWRATGGASFLNTSRIGAGLLRLRRAARLSAAGRPLHRLPERAAAAGVRFAAAPIPAWCSVPSRPGRSGGTRCRTGRRRRCWAGPPVAASAGGPVPRDARGCAGGSGAGCGCCYQGAGPAGRAGDGRGPNAGWKWMPTTIQAFARDFVAAWTKVMNLDRFDLA